MFKSVCLLVLVTLFLVACNQNSDANKDSKNLDVELDSSINMSLKLSENAEEDIIFYNMLYPIDLGIVIDKRNSYFNSNLLNPLNNISAYQDSRQMALALGVFGADLSYLWVFEQSQQALSYFSAIKELAYELGIPENEVKMSAIRAEKYTDNIDSLVHIARDSYQSCDAYLKSSGKEELAALILLGGWIETLHTSLYLYQEANERMALKILSQKYSLASLINLLSQQNHNAQIAAYTQKLFVLLNLFDELQNKYLSNQLEIDTLKQTVTLRANGKLEIEPNELAELKGLIAELRNSLIE